MNETLFYEFIPVFALCGVLTLFFIVAFRFLKLRKRRHAESYAGDVENFQQAVINEDAASMSFYGDKVIWNEFLEQSDKKRIYEAVKSRVQSNFELDQLWKDVHYKTHGYDPLKDAPLDEWSIGGNYTATQEDIIDR